jgi:hypothetical protein
VTAGYRSVAFGAVKRVRVLGYREPVEAEDLDPGDVVEHEGAWFRVDWSWVDAAKNAIHLSLIPAKPAEVAAARAAGCEGHESLRGDSMGVTVECDGTCV